MSVDHASRVSRDDRKGVFVPMWAMDECAGDTAQAVVLAQITWWLQPAQRDGRRRTVCTVERGGHLWLFLTDGELAEDVGMRNADQARRARLALKRAGLIETKSGQVDGRKVTLIRPLLDASDPADVRERSGESAESDPAKVRSRPRECAESSSIETREDQNQKTRGGAEAPSPDDVLRADALALARLAFEQNPKPLTAFLNVRDRLAESLAAGISYRELETLIRRGGIVWSRLGLETALAKSKPNGKRSTLATLVRVGERSA